jgi:hypothetical protein
MDGDVQGDRLGQADRPLLAQGGAAGQHVEGTFERPLRVVLMGDRRPEDGEDGIAEIFRDEAVEAGNGLGEGLEQSILKGAHLFRIQTLGQRGESGEIGEEDRHLSAIRLALRVALRARRAAAPRGRGRGGGRCPARTGWARGGVRRPGGAATRAEGEVGFREKAASGTGSRLPAAASWAEGEARR